MSARVWLCLLLVSALAPGCSTAPPMPADELARHLDEHNVVLMPEGEGPFPAVLLLHACFGNLGHVDRWARTLQSRGFAAVVVNSMSARGLQGHFDNVAVCSGLVLRPEDRARDITVTVEMLRKIGPVDMNRISVVGFSHGGWTVLEYLGQQDDDRAGSVATQVRESLRSIVVVYPYCGGEVAAGLERWPRDVNMLMLLAENDRTVGTSTCEKVAHNLSSRGYAVTLHIYPGVEHGYDVEPELVWGHDERYNEAAANDTRKRIIEYLRETLAITTAPGN